MIVLIHRPYIFRNSRLPRALAGVTVAAVVAGCGIGGGGSAQPGAGATPAPTPSAGGLGVGSDLAGGNGPSGRAAGKIVHGSAGKLARQQPLQLTRTTAGSVSKTSGLSVVSKQSAQQAQQRAQQQAQKAAQQAAQQQAAQQQAAKQQAAKTTPTKSPAKATTPKTITVHAQTPPRRTTVRTVTKTQVRTVVRTVTKTVAPDVPAGAFMPSKHPVLAQQSFTVAGSNVACTLARTGIRCGILRRVWAAPVQPASCKASWGDTIALQRRGLPKFVCGGANPMSANAKVIPVGWDDKVGDFICEVRSFGVDCFSPGRSGFILSRTGYAFY